MATKQMGKFGRAKVFVERSKHLGACAPGSRGDEVRGYGLKHQKEKRRLDYSLELHVSVRKTERQRLHSR